MAPSTQTDSTAVVSISATAQPGTLAVTNLVQGTAVGRYVVLQRVGSGGMGVVYAAFDPELDRKVALKLLFQSSDEPSISTGRARLLREAQALAKLHHPNVVPVHDVGTFEPAAAAVQIRSMRPQMVPGRLPT